MAPVETIEELAQKVARGEELNAQQRERLALYIKENEEQKKSAEHQAKRLDDIRAELSLLKDINIEKDIELKNRRASAYIREKELEVQEISIELEKQREIAKQAQIKANNTGDDADIAKAKKEAANLVEVNNRYEKQNGLLKDRNSGNQAASQILDSIGVKTEDQFNVVEKGMKAVLEGGEGLENFATSFGKGMTDKFSASNIAISLLSKTVESTIMMVKMADTTFASFNKTTGATGELNNEIYSSQIFSGFNRFPPTNCLPQA